VTLPNARQDLSQALGDLDDVGIALISNAFSPAEIDEAQAVTMSLAAFEREDGSALLHGGTQRIYGLIQKAPIFRRLVVNPQMLALVHHLLGPRIMLYSMQAHIVPRGGEMDPHFDQLEFSPLPPFVCTAAVVIMLEDFTAQNGATRIAMGRFAKDAGEPAPPTEAMTPMVGAKGTLAAYGGLLWHSTGVNHTQTPRCGLLLHFCLPWVRQHENYQRTISAAVARDMSPELRDLLGIHERLFGRRWRSSAPEFRPARIAPDE
jgi:ectoine hydroxylase-related dioxygenase (phytanoyl-CoA dioxygenase family)